MGDRFAHQAKAQLQACLLASRNNGEIVPVWNKSNREHTIIGSEPSSVRAAAARAIKELGWNKTWHVDADHIRLNTVDRFLDSSDFFTIDVSDSIGMPASADDISAFVRRHPDLADPLQIPRVDHPIVITPADVERVARKYLCAIQDAGRIYRHIAAAKGEGSFITEVSLDEAESPQTPLELLIILAAMADEKIPLQTIAPKFTGRFNKGVDYTGDVAKFEREFNDDLAVIDFAVKKYGLPANLKLSIHSGSDKFSIYPAMRKALKRFNAGLHIKTAGTSWLEELVGLAEAGGDALELAREIYCEALDRRAELCAPYALVIDIDPARLPSKEQVKGWSSAQYAAALRHDQGCGEYNPHFRQLLHVAFKIAAKKGDRYLGLLEANEAIVARNVTNNLYERHLKPLLCNINDL